MGGQKTTPSGAFSSCFYRYLGALRRVGKGALAPCPPSAFPQARSTWWARDRTRVRTPAYFAHPTAQNGISSSMSLLRAPAPAAPARRGAALEGPPDPKSPPAESSDPKPPLPPPARSSMVSVELKFCSTTSVE